MFSLNNGLLPAQSNAAHRFSQGTKSFRYITVEMAKQIFAAFTLHSTWSALMPGFSQQRWQQVFIDLKLSVMEFGQEHSVWRETAACVQMCSSGNGDDTLCPGCSWLLAAPMLLPARWGKVRVAKEPMEKRGLGQPC